MTTMRPLLWRWNGHRMVGMLYEPPVLRSDSGSLAALLLPGGAQTRIGADRALVALARLMAARGIPTLACDWAGQGDSEGTPVPFAERAPQIAAARAALTAATGVHHHLVIGICDGASAALLAAGEEGCPEGTRSAGRLTGLVLVNCWMRDDDLAPPRGWLTGGLVRRLSGRRGNREGGGALARLPSWRGLWAGLRAARLLRKEREGALEERLRAAATVCPAPILWVMSRHDPTGRDALVRLRHPRWRRLMRTQGHRRLVLAGDDHGLCDPRSRLAVVAKIREIFPPAIPPADNGAA